MKKGFEQQGFHYILTIFLLLSAFLATANQTIFAQAGQSELTGTITDANGAVIPH